MEETKLILGLDIGTNSVGWAVVSGIPLSDKLQMRNGELLDMGSRIFPEGVNRDTKGKEVSKNEDRRLQRQARRQLFRRKIRKQKLKRMLQSLGMYPRTTQEEQDFFILNPYQLRKMAAEGRQLSMLELGRVLYHLAQRRGYHDTVETPLPKDSELRETDKETGKTGINETQAAIEELREKGLPATIGYYAATLYEAQLQNPFDTPRIRNRYTLRDMYLHEFDLIWEKQREFYPDLLDEQFKKDIGDHNEGILFYKRPLRSQKHLLGKCTFEPQKTRCVESALIYEEFRAYQFLTNIRYNATEPLNISQMDYLFRELFTTKKSKFKFKEIRKKLKDHQAKNYNDGIFADSTIAKVNYLNVKFNYDDEHEVPNASVTQQFRSIFTPQRWDSMSEKEKEDAWHLRYDAKGDRSVLLEIVMRKYGFDEIQAETFTLIKMKQGYASLSRKAMRLILSYLKLGFGYSQAVVLGGIENALGADRWKVMSQETQDEIIQQAVGIMENNNLKGGYMQKIEGWLQNNYQLSDTQLKKLYHHSQINEGNYLGRFPRKGDVVGEKRLQSDDEYINNVRNPIVQAALFEVRKLVETLLQEFGKFDIIKVEMARELKMPKKKRDEIGLQNYKREQENNKIKQYLEENHIPITKTNIQKMILFKELEKDAGTAISPYSGKTFGISQLFGKGREVDIDHIIPYSISLDDSIANKTLCFVSENLEKGNRTPYEAFGMNADRWEAIKANVRDVYAKKLFPENKYKRFIAKEHAQLDEFISRQLNDTAYISRFTKEMLKFVCKDVRVISGGATAMLRHLWGLNHVLNPVLPVTLRDGEYWVAMALKQEDREAGFEYEPIEYLKWEETHKEKELKALMKKKHPNFVRILFGNVRNNHFYPSKMRDDHRHHAIDAAVLACTERTHLHNIATMNTQGKSQKDIEAYFTNRQGTGIFPRPFDGFEKQLRDKVLDILVSYKSKKRRLMLREKTIYKKDATTGKTFKYKGRGLAARGSLHDATIHGKVEQNERGETLNNTFRHRVPIEKIENSKQLKEVASSSIRRLIEERLTNVYGINLNQEKFDIPVKKDFYFKWDEKTHRRIPQIYLTDKQSGKKIPVYKVRIHTRSSNMKQLNEARNAWVEPGNNDHVLIYQQAEKKLGEVVSFWDAVKAIQEKGKAINPDPEKGELVMTLTHGDMVLMDILPDQIDWQNLPQKRKWTRRLYKLQKFSDGKLHFALHNASGVNPDTDNYPLKIQKTPNTLMCTKVRITPTGRIELCPQV